MAPTQLSVDLTPFAGQTVRLRVANAVNDYLFNAAIDAVSITSTPPSNVFPKGKLKLNKKNGTGTLTVTVPGAGVLTLTDASSTKKATASKRKPKLVKPATLKPTAGRYGEGPAEADRGRQEDPEEEGEAEDQGHAELHPDRRHRQHPEPQGHAEAEARK